MVIKLNAPTQTVHNDSRLLKNFFEHKMGVVFFFDRLKTHGQFVHFFGNWLILDCFNIVSITPHNRHLTIVEIDHFRRMLNHRGCIGGNKHLPVSQAEKQRRPLSRHINPIGLIKVDDGQAVGSNNLLQSQLDGPLKAHSTVIENLFNEVNDHFRIGITLEDVPFFLQGCLEGMIVFDNAIMHK